MDCDCTATRLEHCGHSHRGDSVIVKEEPMLKSTRSGQTLTSFLIMLRPGGASKAGLAHAKTLAVP